LRQHAGGAFELPYLGEVCANRGRKAVGNAERQRGFANRACERQPERRNTALTEAAIPEREFRARDLVIYQSSREALSRRRLPSSCPPRYPAAWRSTRCIPSVRGRSARSGTYPPRERPSRRARSRAAA